LYLNYVLTEHFSVDVHSAGGRERG